MIRLPIVCRILALFNLVIYLGLAYAAYSDLNRNATSNTYEKLGTGGIIFFAMMFLTIIFANISTLIDGESNIGHAIFLLVVGFFTMIGIIGFFFIDTQTAQAKNDHPLFLDIVIAISLMLPTLLIVLLGKPEPTPRRYCSNNGPYTQPNSDAYD